jgi:hypothetical protein
LAVYAGDGVIAVFACVVDGVARVAEEATATTTNKPTPRARGIERKTMRRIRSSKGQ